MRPLPLPLLPLDALLPLELLRLLPLPDRFSRPEPPLLLLELLVPLLLLESPLLLLELPLLLLLLLELPLLLLLLLELLLLLLLLLELLSVPLPCPRTFDKPEPATHSNAPATMNASI